MAQSNITDPQAFVQQQLDSSVKTRKAFDYDPGNPDPIDERLQEFSGYSEVHDTFAGSIVRVLLTGLLKRIEDSKALWAAVQGLAGYIASKCLTQAQLDQIAQQRGWISRPQVEQMLVAIKPGMTQADVDKLIEEHGLMSWDQFVAQLKSEKLVLMTEAQLVDFVGQAIKTAIGDRLNKVDEHEQLLRGNSVLRPRQAQTTRLVEEASLPLMEEPEKASANDRRDVTDSVRKAGNALLE